ncbi:MAG: tail fiber domain-containing protein [Deltaproteobacteria bacterium]|nr:tail fiber domain-containing protein [Deltaproteobacteria bacterium]
MARVSAMPLSTWRFRAEASRARHMGPMAQDFYAAFGLGDDDKHISTIDADGVALAAIQGLNQKMADENQALRAHAASSQAETAVLKARLERVEAMLAAGAPPRTAGGTTGERGKRRSDVGFVLLGFGVLAVGGIVVMARRRGSA